MYAPISRNYKRTDSRNRIEFVFILNIFDGLQGRKSAPPIDEAVTWSCWAFHSLMLFLLLHLYVIDENWQKKTKIDASDYFLLLFLLWSIVGQLNFIICYRNYNWVTVTSIRVYWPKQKSLNTLWWASDSIAHVLNEKNRGVSYTRICARAERKESSRMNVCCWSFGKYCIMRCTPRKHVSVLCTSTLSKWAKAYHSAHWFCLLNASAHSIAAIFSLHNFREKHSDGVYVGERESSVRRKPFSITSLTACTLE